MANNPVRQHFIPRSYLRNFAEARGNEYYVEASNKDGAKIFGVNIKDICVEKNLYTYPPDATSDGDPYWMEKFFANNADGPYPEVYDLLVNSSRTHITKEERKKILYTTLSLYFRTPRFYRGIEQINNELLDRVITLNDPNSATIHFSFEGATFEFERDKEDEFRAKWNEDARIAALEVQFQGWHDFVEHKSAAGIIVNEVMDDVELITSDNPVSIFSMLNRRFHLFDPSNAIHVPLDSRHYLMILGNDIQSDPNILQKGKRDRYFAVSTNNNTMKRAERWIIGKKGTLHELPPKNENTG